TGALFINGSPVKPIVTSFRTGVAFGSVVPSTAWYWMYRDRPVMDPPDAAIGVNDVQLASGTCVSPMRTLSATLVPAGTSADHAMCPQFEAAPGSNTRDRNVPVDAY